LSYTSFMTTRDAFEVGGKGGEKDPVREAWGLLAGLVYPPPFLELARRLGITPAVLGAVRTLDQARTMGEIAGFLRCDPSNVTGIVDSLEEKGLARRRPSERDRRVKLIELTDRGRQMRARLDREMRKPPKWLKALPEADQRALRDILRRAAAPTG
jgi:DNA-binding MarR family transcriptional regulator